MHCDQGKDVKVRNVLMSPNESPVDCFCQSEFQKWAKEAILDHRPGWYMSTFTVTEGAVFQGQSHVLYQSSSTSVFKLRFFVAYIPAATV
jgi:hypothetical protein